MFYSAENAGHQQWGSTLRKQMKLTTHAWLALLEVPLVVVQSLSHVRLFATPWTIARQASLSSTISQSSLKLMSLSRWCHPTISSSVVPFSSCPQSFPTSGSFPISRLFTSGDQSIGASASASVLLMKTRGWFPLGLVWSPCCPRDSQTSLASQFKSTDS